MKGKIVIHRELCKGCGFCVSACPQDLIDLDKKFNAMGYHPVVTSNNSCSGCGLCEIVCPDLAIEVWRRNEKRQKSKAGKKK
jgi:2-oxoglutarate ferredoxin oxidoreductase subunit delta